MKKRRLLIRSYLSMLMYDILTISISPIKSDWAKLRSESKTIYKLIEITVK